MRENTFGSIISVSEFELTRIRVKRSSHRSVSLTRYFGCCRHIIYRIMPSAVGVQHNDTDDRQKNQIRSRRYLLIDDKYWWRDVGDGGCSVPMRTNGRHIARECRSHDRFTRFHFETRTTKRLHRGVVRARRVLWSRFKDVCLRDR